MENYADVPIKGSKNGKNFLRHTQGPTRASNTLSSIGVPNRSRSQSERNLKTFERSTSAKSQKTSTSAIKPQKNLKVVASKSQRSINCKITNQQTAQQEKKFISSENPQSSPTKQTFVRSGVILPQETEEIVQIGGKFVVRKVRYEYLDLSEHQSNPHSPQKQEERSQIQPKKAAAETRSSGGTKIFQPKNTHVRRH